MREKHKIIGSPVSRIEGHLKVTGKAAYAAEFSFPHLMYGFPVQSTITAGEIKSIDVIAAERSPGVLKIITHHNALKLMPRPPVTHANRMTRSNPVLQNTRIHCFGQYIGLVVAETYEQARFAARLVKVSYKTERPKIDFDENLKDAYKPEILNAGHPTDTSWGDLESGLKQSAEILSETYNTPIEQHNPMEPHATIAFFEGERLTVYESTQILGTTKEAIANTFNIPKENIQVLAPFIGGGFGSKLQPREHLMLTVMAAKMLNRPVKTAITRQMMQTNVGLRQHNRQKVRIGTEKDGKLLALSHEIVTHTSVDEEFIEQSGAISRMMYEVPNSLVTHRVFTTNIQVPRWTRAPGETPGSFALESAMDEMAHRLKIDPIEFRTKNEPSVNPENKKPWASRSVIECMRMGAEKFGWNMRNSEPMSTRNGRWLVGYGMASASRGAPCREASARVKITNSNKNIRARIELAATDIGTGSYTIIAQVAAERLGLPVEKIKVIIGDSDLPPTPGSGGSWGAGTYTNAVDAVCEKAKNELLGKSKIKFVNEPGITELMKAAALNEYQTEGSVKPSEESEKYSHFSFGAHFAEVWVDESLGIVKIPRFTSAIAAGTILNEKTARSQIISGVVWGIGQALTEESVLDKRYGNYVTRTFADYHVPVNLDIGNIEVYFLHEEDKTINRLGVKGVGELGITSVAATIANAIFNATGKRIRDLPITPDKLLL
ncbi:acylaldehyde oxidase [Niastella yeongjuensis]|uniref:Acylaldehyde oxidase n=1 Tax=Niastella yeongjuensis TaxID=354355 RepID=A0A1V9EDH8_9BACT|nr:xanthine dehydrogenase family protein molybdopterin-binding subunit [Niastella yeongjuensis]OQP44169.1 acylaldehyde oxidase [Niastella yeongjuensis]SEP21958.1 xanthine dehydrogenase YagR molybdenum-binding subunit [Niastella yeongjuensis]